MELPVRSAPPKAHPAVMIFQLGDHASDSASSRIPRPVPQRGATHNALTRAGVTSDRFCTQGQRDMQTRVRSFILACSEGSIVYGSPPSHETSTGVISGKAGEPSAGRGSFVILGGLCEAVK